MIMSLLTNIHVRRCLSSHFGRSSSRFSISHSCAGQRIPPESPSYIRLQDPPQSNEFKLKRTRGHLPVPRELFARLHDHQKALPEYVQRTAPKPAKQRKPINEAQKWRASMAASRRLNLGVSLQKLWRRRSKIESVRMKRNNRELKERAKALAAPERLDDRLTRSTMLSALLNTKVILDPNRFKLAKRQRLKLETSEIAKKAARRHAITELYNRATDFIVKDTDLRVEIDKRFTNDYFKNVMRGITENIWGVYGRPQSISKMLKVATGASEKLVDQAETEFDRSSQRQKRIAEDLTGGAI